MGVSVGASVIIAATVAVGSAVSMETGEVASTIAVGAAVVVGVVSFLSSPLLPIRPRITKIIIMGNRQPDFFLVLRFAKVKHYLS